MTMPVDANILLVANPDIRRATLWGKLRQWRVRAVDRREFSLDRDLTGDTHVLLYQVGPRVGDTLRLLEKASARQHDLCIILLGSELRADRVARFLRRGAYDYLVWPCPLARVAESIASGMANRRTFLEVRSLSDELVSTNRSLAQDRDMLAQGNRNLSLLHRLTQTLTGTLEEDAIVKALFVGLPPLIDADVIALARTDSEQVWTWSKTNDCERANTVRAELRDRLGRTVSGEAVVHRHLRLLRSPRLSIVPRVHSPAQDQNDCAAGIHEVRLAFGQSGTGILRVEREGERSFTEQEQQLIATAGASLALALANADAHRQIQELALRDPLTGAFNRRALDGLLHRELKAGLRYGMPACLLLLDLDYFKTVNDRLGHVAGDGVLKGVAVLVQDAVREVDTIGRYGGEEFAIVLPHTDLGQAHVLAERIRAEIERHAFEAGEGQVRITASLGVASLRDSSIGTVGHWISAADSALYQAKSEGRNRVATHAAGHHAPSHAAVRAA